jgi:hypothetical protein
VDLRHKVKGQINKAGGGPAGPAAKTEFEKKQKKNTKIEIVVDFCPTGKTRMALTGSAATISRDKVRNQKNQKITKITK